MKDSAKGVVKVKVTGNEGQVLLRISSGFGLPEKLGDASFNIADRDLAVKDARLLYREIKSRSPLLSQDRKPCFGPLDNWKLEGSDGNETAKMIDPLYETELKLSEDALSGAYWCLLLAVHPGSGIVMGAGAQEETIWPLAKKLRLVNALEKATGADKALHKRFDLDPEEGDVDTKDGETKDWKKVTEEEDKKV